MPSAGTATSPSAIIRKTNSSIRLEAESDRSSRILPKNGRKKASIISVEKPSACSLSAADDSGRRKRPSSEPRRTRLRNRAMRRRSAREPTLAVSERHARSGLRHGSESSWKWEERRTSAPGRNGFRSRAR
jgi:hypothetical protein